MCRLALIERMFTAAGDQKLRSCFQPCLDALTLQHTQRIRAFTVVHGFPEAGVVLVNLAHTGIMQAWQFDHVRTECLGLLQGM